MMIIILLRYSDIISFTLFSSLSLLSHLCILLRRISPFCFSCVWLRCIVLCAASHPWVSRVFCCFVLCCAPHLTLRFLVRFAALYCVVRRFSPSGFSCVLLLCIVLLARQGRRALSPVASISHWQFQVRNSEACVHQPSFVGPTPLPPRTATVLQQGGGVVSQSVGRWCSKPVSRTVA